eukprot:Skav225758  [mRNA]  locus=scaffold3552:22008:24846:+ [translate_table: standard]
MALVPLAFLFATALAMEVDPSHLAQDPMAWQGAGNIAAECFVRVGSHPDDSEDSSILHLDGFVFGCILQSQNPRDSVDFHDAKDIDDIGTGEHHIGERRFSPQVQAAKKDERPANQEHCENCPDSTEVPVAPLGNFDIELHKDESYTAVEGRLEAPALQMRDGHLSVTARSCVQSDTPRLVGQELVTVRFQVAF